MSDQSVPEVSELDPDDLGDLDVVLDPEAPPREPDPTTYGMRHAVVDPEGVIINIVLWDGTSEYDPGDGLQLVALPDRSPLAPGDTVTI